MSYTVDEGITQALSGAGLAVVKKSWVEAMVAVVAGRYGCPFCGSMGQPIVKEEDKFTHSRAGCGECGEWWEPVRAK